MIIFVAKEKEEIVTATENCGKVQSDECDKIPVR